MICTSNWDDRQPVAQASLSGPDTVKKRFGLLRKHPGIWFDDENSCQIGPLRMACLELIKHNSCSIYATTEVALGRNIRDFQSTYKEDGRFISRHVVRGFGVITFGAVLVSLFQISPNQGMKRLLMVSSIFAITYGLWITSRAVFVMHRRLSYRMIHVKKILIDYKLAVLRHLDPSLNYSPSVSFPKRTYDDCGLFSPDYNYSCAEDLISGTIEDIRFDICTIQTAKICADSHGHERRSCGSEPRFHGLFIRIDLKTSFEGHTIIVTDRAEQAYGIVANGIEHTSHSISRLKVIPTGNREFESEYKVYSDNNLHARYVLSPKLVEYLTSLRKKDELDLQLAFKDSQLLVAIPKTIELHARRSGLGSTDGAKVDDEFETFLLKLTGNQEEPVPVILNQVADQLSAELIFILSLIKNIDGIDHG